MPPKKKDENITIKQFKDKSSNWFVGNVHYHLNEQGEIVFCAGGIDNPEYRELLSQYIKRNKKSYVPREKSIFEQEEIEYSKIGFGKYAQTTTIELVSLDKRYASWLYKNCTDSKIKAELKELLKIK